MKAVLALLATAAFAASPAARLSALLEPVLKPTGHFDARGCKYSLASVTQFVVLGTAFTQDFKFGPGCDLEGRVNVTTAPFPVDLKLRHLGRLSRVKGEGSVSISSTEKLAVVIDARLGKATISYQGSETPLEGAVRYSVGYADLGSLGQPAVSGGTLEVSRFEGKPVSFSAPLKAQR